MEENITFLNDDELDGIVGGAFNQSIIKEHNLKIHQSLSKTEGLHIRIVRSNPDGSLKPYDGMTTERGLDNAIAKGNVVSLAVEDTSGKMVELTKDEIASIIVK
ncbi:hypothetical protein LJB81_01765 [Desulfovibrio sp. OttesenSCG-928-M14]|nr:hypothetical protein [Desulfovibrio sp. OttesenSCG-928-M14]